MFKDAIVVGIYHDAKNVGPHTPRWNQAPPPAYSRLFPNYAAADHNFKDTSSLRYTDIASRMNLNPKDTEVFKEGM